MRKEENDTVSYLETMAATAPDHKCFVVLTAPAPAPRDRTFPLIFSSNSTIFSVSSDEIFSPLHSISPTELLTNPLSPFTDKLTDKNPLFLYELHLTIEFDLVLHGIEERNELGVSGSRKRPPIGTSGMSSGNHSSSQGMATVMAELESESRV